MYEKQIRCTKVFIPACTDEKRNAAWASYNEIGFYDWASWAIKFGKAKIIRCTTFVVKVHTKTKHKTVWKKKMEYIFPELLIKKLE